jgi:Mg-chelatase subunit ChlD
VIIMMALLIITLMAMLAFAVDIGYIVTLQAQLDRAVDAGALAGAGTLAEGQVEAEQNVYTFVGMNPVGGVSLPAEQVQIEVGNWNPAAKSFGPTAEAPSALRVRAFRTGVPFFFARALGHEYFDVSSEAIAMYQPRDIVVVLDYSASMSDDSELRHISTIGQPAVEANLLQIYEELGSPTFGNMQWQPVYISSNYTSTVKTTLGLNSVPYPYPSGSWNDYINYVKSSSSTYIVDAGYYKRYGYLTLVNYWLEKKPMASETPVLWMTSEQPITAVKEAVTVFLAYLQEVETDDRVGLAVYTAADGTSVLETGLTQDLPFIEDISRHRQAGHYDRYTNIGAGIQKARIELEQNARPGAFKMIVLMTDGIANRPTDEATGRAYALEEAELCAAAKYPIVTISLGAEADTDLMQQIADLTGGVHFNIPGGQSVELYEEQLKDVFRQIAANRPLKLVK